MSILIKDMEMPKEYPLWIVVSADGTVQYNYFNEWKTAEEKAVPVPPHGRLIDADALKQKQQEDADIFKDAYTPMEKTRRDEALNAVANIVNAPTIIPAEEDE